jgi:chitinase
VANYEVDDVAALLDMLNLMTYDLNGPWDPHCGHNAPLYAPDAADTLRNLDAAFRLYAGTYHIDPSKINLGVPFYGHAYANCTALGAPHAGADRVHFPPQGAFYYAIREKMDKFTKHWDERAAVPYYVSTDWNVLVSCEDERSVGLKAEYVGAHNACGLIIWEITGDVLANGETPLLDAIVASFRNPRK